MKRLNKKEIATKGELFQALTDAATAYNAAHAAVNDWRQTVVDRMDEYEGERSERWEESEAAETFRSWREQWEQEVGEEVDEAAAENAADEMADSMDEV